MRYFLVFLTFFSSLSAGCSLEIPKGFQAFASFVASENKYIIRFPLTDSAQEPRYISSLTLEINNVASADLEYTQVDGFVVSEVVINNDYFEAVRIIGSYNYGDAKGSSMSFCANWKSLTLEELIQNQGGV